MAKELAHLYVKMSADSAQLRSDMQKVARSTQTMERQMTRASRVVMSAFAGISAAVVVAQFTRMTRAVLDAGDAAAKMAQKVGTSVEDISALSYSADLSGVSMRQLETAMIRLNKTLGSTDTEAQEVQKILDALEITGGNAYQVIGQLADRFAQMRDGAAKTAAATEIFGRAGAALIPLLNGGSKAIEANRAELESLGALMTTDLAKASERVNDDMTRLGTAMKGLGIQLGQTTVPALADMTEGMVAWLATGNRVEDMANRIRIAFEAMGVAIKVSAGFIAGGLVGGVPGALVGAGVAGVDELLDRAEERRNTGQSVTGLIERTRPAPDTSSVDKYSERLRTLFVDLKAASAAESSAARTRAAAQRAYEQQQAAIQGVIDALQREYDTLGMGAAAIVAYDLAAQGAAPAQIAFAQSIARATEAARVDMEIMEQALRAREDLAAEIEQIANETFAALMTQEASLRTAAARRQELVRQAVADQILAEERGAAIIAGIHEKLNRDLQDMAEKSKDQFTAFAEEAAANVQNVMADTLFNWMQGEFGNIEQDFKRMLDRMVANALAARLGEALFGAGFGAGGGSELGGLFGRIAGAFGGARAAGGPVSPGRAYLVGEKGPELMVPSGVGRIVPNDQLGGGGVVVNINVSGVRDSADLRQSSGQLAAQAGLAVQRAMRRNT